MLRTQLRAARSPGSAIQELPNSNAEFPPHPKLI
jgi:hypothetical protein